MPPSSQSASAFTVGDEVRLRMTVKTLIGIVLCVSVAVGAWYSLKADVAAHSGQLTTIQTTLGADHDLIKVQGTLIQQQGLLLERIDRKIDRWGVPARTTGGPQ